jgi:hypothetical protein
MPNSVDRFSEDYPPRTAAERAAAARLADCMEKEQRSRSRIELGLDSVRPACAAHGRPGCGFCKDWTIHATAAA